MTTPRVLVVEDEVIVAEDVRCRLKNMGYQNCSIALSSGLLKSIPSCSLNGMRLILHRIPLSNVASFSASLRELFISLIKMYSKVMRFLEGRGVFEATSNNCFKGYFLLIGIRAFLKELVAALREIARLTGNSCPNRFISGTRPAVETVIRLCEKLKPKGLVKM